MKKIMITFLLIGALPLSAMAREKARAERPAEKHSGGIMDQGAMVDPDKGDGCGLGWQVTQKRTIIATTTRATTNAVVPPTFGMTSGTIGCEQHSFSKADRPATVFAFNNYDSLSIEMAQGHGEFLEGFAKTLGCNSDSMSAFGAMTQKNYQKLIGNEKTSAGQFIRNVKQEIRQDRVLSANCSA